MTEAIQREPHWRYATSAVSDSFLHAASCSGRPIALFSSRTVKAFLSVEGLRRSRQSVVFSLTRIGEMRSVGLILGYTQYSFYTVKNVV